MLLPLTSPPYLSDCGSMSDRTDTRTLISSQSATPQTNVRRRTHQAEGQGRELQDLNQAGLEFLTQRMTLIELLVGPHDFTSQVCRVNKHAQLLTA